MGLAEAAVSGLLTEGLTVASEHIVANKVDIIITFIQTLVDCPDCNTSEDFATQFATNYAANVAIGKITGTILSPEVAQKVGAYMYQKFEAAGSSVVAATKKALIPITELKNKALSYVDNVWQKVRAYIPKENVPWTKYIRITSQDLIERELLNSDLRGMVFLVEQWDLSGNVVATKTIEISTTWSQMLGKLQKMYYPYNLAAYRYRFGTNLNANSLGSGNIFSGKSYMKIEKNNGLACFLDNEDIIPATISSVERFTNSHFIIKEIWKR